MTLGQAIGVGIIGGILLAALIIYATRRGG